MTVDQDQGTAGTQAAQIGVGAAGAAAVVDAGVLRRTGHGRQRLDQVADGDSAGVLDLLGRDGNHGTGGFQIHAANMRTCDHDGLQGLGFLIAVGVLREGGTGNTQGSHGTQRKGRLHALVQLTAVESHCTLQVLGL